MAPVRGLAVLLLGLGLGVLLFARGAVAQGEWDYGDATFEEVDLCLHGTQQSPVDFRGAARRRLRATALAYGGTEGEIFNTGSTIEVETHGDNTLTVGGVEYALIQFHFHLPSEHRLRGRGHDMELHLVHQSAEGALAVIGVYLQRGVTSGALAPIFDALPDDVDVHHELPEAFDPREFLPRALTHSAYAGSLTTPPCAEGVQWLVMSQPMTVSDAHMRAFNERVVFNARPVQRSLPPRRGR